MVTVLAAAGLAVRPVRPFVVAAALASVVALWLSSSLHPLDRSQHVLSMSHPRHQSVTISVQSERMPDHQPVAVIAIVFLPHTSHIPRLVFCPPAPMQLVSPHV